MTVITNTSGVLTTTEIMGFGKASGPLGVSGGDTFTLDENNDFLIFPMPYDALITAVFGRFSTVSDWSPTSTITLYVAVAIAEENSNSFKINADTKAKAPVYPQAPPLIPNRNIRIGTKENIQTVKVKKGQCIALAAGMETSGGLRSQSLPFTFTGSIVIERDVGGV